MIDILPSNNHKQPKGLQADERKLLIESYMQKVANRLRGLSSPSDNDKKRWVWELLQNAKDSISNSKERSSVDIEVIVDDEFVCFKHNGEPFTLEALSSLIWQMSGGKRGNSENSGRFGTGFLTTHTLSKNVGIETVFFDAENTKFGLNMTLFREGESDTELEDGILKTLHSKDNGHYPNPQSDWTAFRYKLQNRTNKESAAAGVSSLKSNIFFTLAFADKINSIKLVTNDKTLLVTKSEEKTLKEHLKIVRFSVSENDVQSSVSVIFASSAEYCEKLSKKYKQERQLKYSVAIQVSEDTKEILPILPDTPHLYCVFPLVGTEDFHFPVVVNSPDFEPHPERERLLLAGDKFDVERQEITNGGINKMILSNAVVLYSEVLSYLSDNGWKNIHLLAKGAKELPSQERDFDKDWYEGEIQAELRRHVLDTAMVETNKGFKKLNDIYFPKGGDKTELKEIWRFTNDISQEKLPKLELVDEWSKLIWDECHSQTVKELAKQVSKFNNINALNQSIGWLNNLLLFISKVHKDYLNKYALIPNINGDFRTLEYENLSHDNGLPDCSFKLLSAFGVDWKDIVVKNISAIKLPLNKGYKELSDEINSQIKQKIKSKDNTLLKSILVLLSAIPIKNDNISDDFIEKRVSIWAFSRDIFKEEQPDTFVAEELDETLWEECDEWIIKEMIKKIASVNSINALIESNASLDVQWLNKFIGFIIPQISKDLFNRKEYNIIPNQYGDFCVSLAKGNSIPQELKEDVFINLGIDLKKELIKEQITSFIPEKPPIEVAEVATRINDLLSSKIEDEVKDEVVFRLISLQPSKQNIFQEKLWEFSRVMYGNKVSPQVILKNSHPTLWNVANDYLINKIVSDIEKFTPIETEEESKSSISQFAEYLSETSLEQRVNWNDFAIIWLSDFIDFLSKHEKTIGVIVPNQNDNFCKLDLLYEDKDIHEDLKNILSILDKNSDFRNILIHSGISIKPIHPKTAKDIAKKINEIIKNDYKAQKNDEQFKMAVKLLVVDWFNKPFYSPDLRNEFGYGKTDRISRELFEWSYEHRFELETNVLSSVEERKYLYGLNNQIRELSISFEEIKIITQTEYNKLVAEVAKLKTETHTTESESLISKFNLTEDKIKLLLEIEEEAKQFEGTSNYLEQTAQALINETGIKGEEIVYEYLINLFDKNRVRWVSRSDKNDEGIEEHRYDFEVLEEDLKNVMWYIDAKATLTEESQSDKIPILIRKGTWGFIRESGSDKKNIFLARVFGARNANAGQVQLLKIQYFTNT
jgi:hypothetical protein